MSFHDASLFGSTATPAWIECIGWLLVHSLWQFTLVGLLVAVSNYFLRRASPSERYRMGLVGLFTITLLPVLTAALLNPQLYISTHDSATAISSRDMAQTDEPPLRRSLETRWRPPPAWKEPIRTSLQVSRLKRRSAASPRNRASPAHVRTTSV